MRRVRRCDAIDGEGWEDGDEDGGGTEHVKIMLGGVGDGQAEVVASGGWEKGCGACVKLGGNQGTDIQTEERVFLLFLRGVTACT